MMSYLRRIDLGTLRRNPNVGRSLYVVPGKLEMCGDGVMRRSVEFVHTMVPEGPWLFEYESLDLRCHSCGEDIDADDVVYETVEDIDAVESDRCPVCGAVESFDDVVYETVEDARKRGASS